MEFSIWPFAYSNVSVSACACLNTNTCKWMQFFSFEDKNIDLFYSKSASCDWTLSDNVTVVHTYHKLCIPQSPLLGSLLGGPGLQVRPIKKKNVKFQADSHFMTQHSFNLFFAFLHSWQFNLVLCWSWAHCLAVLPITLVLILRQHSHNALFCQIWQIFWGKVKQI